MATIPSLALIPSGYKASKVYSVLPTDGTGDFDFTRSGNATRVNSEGLIELVSTNVPRLNYPLIDGVVSGCPSLLLEPQRINVIPYSEDFTQGWTESNSTVTSNQIISPDGTLNADKLTEDTSTSNHLIIQAAGGGGVQTNAISVFAKSFSRDRFLQIWVGNTINSAAWIRLDLDNGTITQDNGIAGTGYSISSSSIQDYGNGWYRCILVANKLNTTGTNTIQFRLSEISTGAENNIYLGNGTSGVYIWGAQVEQGSYPTSYIPNYGTALGATRSAETCNNAGDASTFNDSEGVLFVEISALVESSGARVISIGEGLNYENGIIMSFDTSDNLIKYKVRSNNVTTVDISKAGVNRTLNHKISLKYNVNDFALWIDGFKVSSVSSGAVPLSLSKLQFSDMNVSSAPFYGNTKQIQYFPTALTDSELETLTSWDSFSDMAIGQLYTIE
jgi:hypothetical protein